MSRFSSLARLLGALTIMLTLATGCKKPQDIRAVKKPQNQSSPHTAAVQGKTVLEEIYALEAQSTAWRHKASKAKPAEKFAGWTQEKEHRARIAQLVKDQPGDTGKMMNLYYQGWAEAALAAGEDGKTKKGSGQAEKYFSQALDMLNQLLDKSPIPQANETRAAFLNARADNMILLGDDAKAMSFLKEALQAAQSSTYKGQLGEGTIQSRIAGAYYRAQRWQEALAHGEIAAAIMVQVVDNGGELDKEPFIRTLFVVVDCKKKLGLPFEDDFNKFTKYGGKLIQD